MNGLEIHACIIENFDFGDAFDVVFTVAAVIVVAALRCNQSQFFVIAQHAWAHGRERRYFGQIHDFPLDCNSTVIVYHVVQQLAGMGLFTDLQAACLKIKPRYPDSGETMSSKTQSSRSLWLMVGAGAIILMVTMGVRNSLGLYIQPISQSTPVNIASISLALAVGQFLWGAIQPIAGALADRYGSRPILMIGMVVLILGLLIAPMWTSSFGLMVSLGVLSAIGSGIGSFSVLMGAVA